MGTMGYSSTLLRTVGVVLLVVGLVALAVGVIYFLVPAHSLPQFMGRVHTTSGHRTKRAIAGVAAGAVLVIGSLFAFLRSRRAAA